MNLLAAPEDLLRAEVDKFESEKPFPRPGSSSGVGKERLGGAKRFFPL
jgi:hypothetical protein